MAAPDEREFVTFLRGQVRDEIILASFRNDLRALVNPETGLAFTEDEIARATQPGSRFYVEADAIDLYGQALQQRAAFLADQVDPRRSTGTFLGAVHAELWLGRNAKQPASGASGTLLAKGAPGTTYVGSPNVPSASATIGTVDGVRYQVLASVTLGASGQAEVAVRAVDTGSKTNQDPGAVVTWSANVPGSSEPTAVVQAVPGSPDAGLEGGVDAETDQQLGERVGDRILARPASGNEAHFRAWGRMASAAVERAFVYPCAMHAGSTLVAPLQKRTAAGPTARLPAAGVLSDVNNFIVPPGSPVVPERVFVLAVAPRAQAVDLVVRLALTAGWQDATPWPNPPVPSVPSQIERVQVTTVTSQTLFQIDTDLALPGNAASLSGTDVPSLMVWDDGRSRFERLLPKTVTKSGGIVTVELLAAPTKTLAAGDRVSPYTDRADAVALAFEQYFDSLGPGELVGALDSRRARASRRPKPHQEYPQRVGQSLATALVDGLGGAASDADLTYASRTEPSLPGTLSDGPNLLTLGKLNVYPLV